MRPSLRIAVCAFVLSLAQAAQAGDAPDERVYQTVRHDLLSVRAAATIKETTGRLLNDPRIRGVAALRKFVTGFSALVSYDRATAMRDLAESFRLAPSPYAAAALAANAIEIGHPDQVLQWVERAVRSGNPQPDAALDIDLHLMRAQSLEWLTKYEDARIEGAKALELARQAGDARILGLALRPQAYRISGAGDKQLALEMLDEAMRLSEAAGDTQAIGYHLLARSVVVEPDTAAKLEALDGAVRVAHQIRDRQLEGRALGARGAMQLGRGDYERVLRDLTAADALLRETGAVRSRATVAGNLSLLFTALGDHTRAEEQSRLAIRLYRLAGNPYGARQALDDLGKLALARGDASLAVSRHEQVVAITRDFGDHAYLRGALVNLGLAYLGAGQHGAAERHVREGLALLMAAANSPDGLALAHAALGDVLRVRGRVEDADRAYRRALASAPELWDRHTVPLRAHHGLGLLASQAGRWDAALAHYRIAIGEIERGRQAARQPGLQVSYFAEKSALYVDAIDALIEAYRHTADAARLREALVFAERAKARTLFDAIAGSAAAPGDADDSIEKMARGLAPSELLIEFVTGANRSFVFTLAGDASVTVHQLPARALIEQQIESLRQIITQRPSPGDDLGRVRQAGSRAYTMLLAPALSARGAKGPPLTRLIIVADGLLFYAPFEAMTIASTGAFLAERYEVVRAASAAVLGAQRSRPAPAAGASRFVGFGDPDVAGAPQPEAELVRALERDGFSFAPLPASRREIEAAAAALEPGEARLYTGRSFTAASVLAELQRPNRIVHFATHAILDERVPDRSGIVLSTAAGNGTPAILRARDLEGLAIPVDLVTLSACQTGLGRVVAGEGVLGLAWAFARAGAASLIVTLWNVSDASSASTMIAFYRALAAGQSKSAALLSARRAIAANPALRHPYFWAGHVLIGDPD